MSRFSLFRRSIGIIGIALCALWLGSSFELWTNPFGLPFDQTWFLLLVTGFVFLPDVLELVTEKRGRQIDG